MKKINQQLAVSIVFSVIFMIGISCSVSSQTEAEAEVTKFLILVETTDNGIKLTGKEGCTFKELSFTLSDYRAQAIDKYGMTSLEKNRQEEDDNLLSFLFTIKKTKDGLSLEGIEGTVWKELKFSCPANNCKQYINQNGMAEI